ncbi:hypothetical protein CORC01_00364 [Colletotrichum orchidophilum]|uniref:Uncharacterized protein n=1 Tax=Colletotrichum orchidophilum TaxID=1209926 RepID=A0A1G4BSU4_9PEZI|nr:uncharacterized protein CORC01_00364 [Colletotrichum orchidophilum]OHF04512.1 hypothetical protein CORC01_00364 [Colletotrichum orchidophilum]
MQQTTTNTAEEGHHLPTEILIKIVESLIADAAAKCLPVNWKIHTGATRKDEITVYEAPDGQKATNLVASLKRFNSIRLPLQICAWTRDLVTQSFPPLPFRVPYHQYEPRRRRMETYVWTRPDIDIFWPQRKGPSFWWPRWTDYMYDADDHRFCLSGSTNDLRHLQMVRFDWLRSGLGDGEDLDRAILWCLSLPNLKQIGIHTHDTNPSHAEELLRGMGSNQWTPQYLHMVGLSSSITLALQNLTEERNGQWEALRDRGISVVVYDRQHSIENALLELFLDDMGICFKLLHR